MGDFLKCSLTFNLTDFFTKFSGVLKISQKHLQDFPFSEDMRPPLISLNISHKVLR